MGRFVYFVSGKPKSHIQYIDRAWHDVCIHYSDMQYNVYLLP